MWWLLALLGAIGIASKKEGAERPSLAQDIWAAQTAMSWRPLDGAEQYEYSTSGLLVGDLQNAWWIPALNAYLLPKPEHSSLWFFYRPSENQYYILR